MANEKKTVYVITKKDEDLNGVLVNVDENTVQIEWENDEIQKLTSEEFVALLETDEYEVEDIELNDDETVQEEESPAAATIHTHASADASNGDADGNPKTRFDWINRIVGQLGAVDTVTLTKIFDQQQSLIGGEAERAGTTKSAQNQASIQMHPSNASATQESVLIQLQKEEIDSLFGETDLTEDFKTKISTLFEASVSARLVSERVKIQEAAEKKVEDAIVGITKSLIDTMESYLDQASEEWLKENEVAIESTLRSELTNEFIDALKGVFVEHYIEIPEERIDVYEALVASHEDMKKQLNDKINEEIETKKSIKALQKSVAVNEAAYGLTLPQVEKLKASVESVVFESEDDFKGKVKTIKENLVVAPKASKGEGILVEVASGPIGEVISENSDPAMDRVADYIRQQVKKA